MVKTDVLTGELGFRSLKPCDLANCRKEDIKAYFNNSYEVYESLFYSIVDDEFYYLCPDRLRLPLIFYYGHTAAVYINKLVLAGLLKPSERVSLELETIFETGVDEMSWDDIENYRMGGAYKWPSVQETKEFRLKVKELINKVIDRTILQLPVRWDEPFWALLMGFEHERIHLETSSVLIRQLPVHMVQRPDGWVYGPKTTASEERIKNEMIQIDETKVRLGKDFNYPSYGWDNEYGRVDCEVTKFEASKFKITNGEFLEFVQSGGYEKRDLWSEDGWNWLVYRESKHPLYWICPSGCKSGCGTAIADHTHCQVAHFTQQELDDFKDSTKIKPFKLRLMFDVVDLPMSWPVEVVYHEAKAFCKWKGDDYRVLTEAEHHAIRDEEEFDLDTSNDIVYQDGERVNHNLTYGSSTPVDLYQPNSKGFYDVFGNVWEWCEDHFNGLPGFKTTYLYDDFSSPCFDGRHNIILGGSWASTGDEASRFARFMFRRHFLQHCGFRVARSIQSENGLKSNPQVRLVANKVFVLGAGFTENQINLDATRLKLNCYQTLNTQYLYDSDIKELERELHKDYLKTPNLSDIVLEMTQSTIKTYKTRAQKALFIGTSTGKVIFELASKFETIVGIDFCGQFLDACMQLQKHGELEHNGKVYRLNNGYNINRICFKQMTWVSNEVPCSDLVLFTMLDRVMNPMSWLGRLKEIVHKNGVLIIVTKFPIEKLLKSIGQEFDLINNINIIQSNVFSIWKCKV